MAIPIPNPNPNTNCTNLNFDSQISQQQGQSPLSFKSLLFFIVFSFVSLSLFFLFFARTEFALKRNKDLPSEYGGSLLYDQAVII